MTDVITDRELTILDNVILEIGVDARPLIPAGTRSFVGAVSVVLGQVSLNQAIVGVAAAPLQSGADPDRSACP